MKVVWIDPMPDRPHEAVLKIEYGSVDNGITLRHVSWQKVVNHNGKVILGQFIWVVPEAVLNDPGIIALKELVERECSNAVLVDGQADDLQRAPGGRT